MINPFEEEDGNAEFMVLVNQECQYSLWPAFIRIPSGWTAIGPRGKRKECLEWIGKTWTDLRPKSLVDAMDAAVSKEGLSRNNWAT